MECDRRQYDRTAACVIAQQYFSATFVSLRFHSRKEKFTANLKNVVLLVFPLFQNCIPIRRILSTKELNDYFLLHV
jgi:hypothetical protein